MYKKAKNNPQMGSFQTVKSRGKQIISRNKIDLLPRCFLWKKAFLSWCFGIAIVTWIDIWA